MATRCAAGRSSPRWRAPPSTRASCTWRGARGEGSNSVADKDKSTDKPTAALPVGAATQDSAVASDATLPAVGTPTPGRVSPGAAARRGPLNYQNGDLVAERYKIVRPIGEGGMGEVYEAEDLLLKERVALKTLRDPVADD